MTVIGMPNTPHRQAQSCSETNTATVLILANFPVIQVATKVSMMAAIASEAPAANRPVANESNYIYAAVTRMTAVKAEPA